MYLHNDVHAHICVHKDLKKDVYTANPTWGAIFACCFTARSSKLERLFSLKRAKRDVRALSFELWKMSPQVGLAVHDEVRKHVCVRMDAYGLIAKDVYKIELYTSKNNIYIHIMLYVYICVY